MVGKIAEVPRCTFAIPFLFWYTTLTYFGKFFFVTVPLLPQPLVLALWTILIYLFIYLAGTNSCVSTIVEFL